MKTLLFTILSFIPSVLFAQLQTDALFYNEIKANKLIQIRLDTNNVRFIYFGTSTFETESGVTTGKHPYGRTENSDVLPESYNFTFSDKKQADTIFVNLLSIPSIPINNFAEISTALREYLFVPAYIQSVANGTTINLKEHRIRVPFPDSLFPGNPLFTYPDSADLSINLSYKQENSITFYSDLGSNAVLSLGFHLVAVIKPVIGKPIEFQFPLLKDYEIRINYFQSGIGFGGLSTEAYPVTIPLSLIGGTDSTLFTLPSITLNYIEKPLGLKEDKSELKPNLISLSAYPNPFNPSTTISLELVEAARISLEIYSYLGQKITTLNSVQYVAKGNHTFHFDASKLSSGIYIIRISGQTSSNQNIQKSIFISLLK